MSEIVEKRLADARARLVEAQEPLGEPFKSILLSNLSQLYLDGDEPTPEEGKERKRP